MELPIGIGLQLSLQACLRFTDGDAGAADEVVVRIGNRACDHGTARFRLCKTEIQGEKKENAENDCLHTATFRIKKMVDSKYAGSDNGVSRLLISCYGKCFPNDQVSGVREFGTCPCPVTAMQQLSQNVPGRESRAIDNFHRVPLQSPCPIIQNQHRIRQALTLR